ncbi:WD40 repeat-like protein [Punctularia strigosozonata HHB-11173 SS5]|uniref:WD40 repeat-like protein n=1 Tax=Punctularia strigosozonata (strain HHB-11173) TaxID=741275 RepID=R7S048_PUNST|nr:WD40 repeat-like protein [Punctularia strigosozonata HHB-11173 SS5]EIN03613.1 WD40 repeat-like protein [Punctularia strigosozonata HHB-11173 SS5]
MPPSDDGMGSTSPPNPPPAHRPTPGPKMTDDDVIFDWDSVSLSEDDEFIAVNPPPVTFGSNPTAKAPNKAGQQPETKSTKPCGCNPNGRNLVVCIDGTANQFSVKNTNVVELYSRLVKDDTQLTYYNSGIGTYARENSWSFEYWKQAFYHTVDMAIAWNFKRIVLDAYRWLSENYQPGDRIFLFGFSRGAYQVRVIAGMIERVGLLHKGNDGQISFAYALYMATTARQQRSPKSPVAFSVPKDGPTPGADAANTDDANLGERNIFSWARKLSFWPFRTSPRASPTAGAQQLEEGSAGVDTSNNAEPTRTSWLSRVWSILACSAQTAKSGNASEGDNDKADDKADPLELSKRFKDALSRKGVKVHFVGAWDTVSSIGIARGPSLPETTTGMKHVCVFRHALALDEVRVKFLPEYANGGVGPLARDDGTDKGDVKEVWFSGSHSDIGGGSNVNLKLDQFGPALRWMSYEASRSGLRTENFQGDWKQVKPTNSMNWFWRMLEWFPLKHLSYDPKQDGEHTRWSWHRASPRRIMDGQLIHESVLDSLVSSSVAQQSDSNISPECSSTPDPEAVSDPHPGGAPGSNQNPEPRAHLPSDMTWARLLLQYKQPQEKWTKIERDPYISAKGVLKDISRKQLSVPDRSVLLTLLSTVDGKRSIADSVDASLLWGKIMQSTEDSDAHTIDCLLSLSAFHMSHHDAPTQTWMRVAGVILSRDDWKSLNLESHQQVVEELKRPFRTITESLLKQLRENQYLSDKSRDLLCTIVETSFGQRVITDIAKESELVKALNTVQNDPDWRYREERITDLLILLGAFPLRSQGTKRYLNHNLARLFPLVQQRPGIDRVFDWVMHTARSKAWELVDHLVNRTGLSIGQRRMLDMLLFTESGRKSIEESGKVTELFAALKDTATDLDLEMEPNLRRTHITDIVAALGAFPSLSPGMEVLLEPEVANVISNLDTDRRSLSTAKDHIASSFRNRAGVITTKLASDGMADADRDVLERMASTDIGKKAFAEGVVTAQLFDALGRVQDRGMDPELRKARVTDIIWVLGKFMALPPGAKQYPRHDLRKLLSNAYQERPEIDEAIMQIKRIFTGRLLKAVEGHTGHVYSVSFSPDGSQFASGSRDITIRIWNADTGKEVGEPLRGHTSGVNSVSFSPDGKRLASGSMDRTVRLWDVETWQQIGQPLEGHARPVLCVAFSPDGDRIVSGSRDETLRLWDAQTGRAIGEPLRGHSDWVRSVAFSPDGENIASGSDDRTIRLWDAETGEPVGDPLRGHDGPVLSVAYSPDGARIVSGSENKTIRIWDTQTRQTVVGPLQGHEGPVRSVEFSPDGKHVVSGSDDGTMRIWDAQTGQTVAGPWEAHWGVSSVAFSPDGKRIVSGGGDNVVKIWDGEVD